MRGYFSVLAGARRVKFFSRMGRAELSLRKKARRQKQGQRRKGGAEGLLQGFE